MQSLVNIYAVECRFPDRRRMKKKKKRKVSCVAHVKLRGINLHFILLCDTT